MSPSDLNCIPQLATFCFVQIVSMMPLWNHTKMTCDISSVNLESLIRKLWDNAEISNFYKVYRHVSSPIEIDEGELQRGISEKRFDYLSGRALKFKWDDNKIAYTAQYDTQGHRYTFKQVFDSLH